jgi:DNA repair protein RecO (recombination protein O)
LAVATRRISQEPAFVLHRYDWSESSLVLEVFTRHYGRIALVARGAKRPSSNFRPVLLPLQPLRVSFGGEGEIRALKEAEWVGGQVMPTGDALLSGYYLNELLMRLLARDDAHAQLFDAYGAAVRVLASEHGEALLPALDAQTLAMTPLADDEAYSLVPEGGLVRAQAGDGRASLSGAQWQALQQALDQAAPFGPVMRAVVDVNAWLKPQLRALLHYHCGVQTLRTRQLMKDLQAL